MREADLKKRLFAIEYYKNGCNATKAAESVGYSPKTARQHGYTLLKDKAVKAELKALNELLSLDKLSQPDKDKIKNGVADIDEVLTTLTKILRREMPEDNVVIVKANKTEYKDDEKTVIRTEEAQIVETRTRPGDVNKAADLLLKYFEKANEGRDEEKGGVIILAEVKQ